MESRQFATNYEDFESSKDSKASGSIITMPAGTIVRHKGEGWEGTVTHWRDGSLITGLPFGANETRIVTGKNLEIRYSA